MMAGGQGENGDGDEQMDQRANEGRESQRGLDHGRRGKIKQGPATSFRDQSKEESGEGQVRKAVAHRGCRSELQAAPKRSRRSRVGWPSGQQSQLRRGLRSGGNC
jgi:hypothetical protein